MSDSDGAFGWVVSLARIWAYVTAVCLVATLLATLVVGIPALSRQPTWAGAGQFVVVLALEIAAMMSVPVVYGLILAILASCQATSDVSGRLSRVETLLDNATNSLKTMSTAVVLTDKAKGYLYHEEELEAFREAVHHYLMMQDYDAASALVDDMERDLNYIDEARRLREEIATSRQATVEEKIQASIRRFQEILDRHDWARAASEADRLKRAMPGNERVAQLPAMIQAARDAHKRQLLQAYGEAIRKNDVDLGIELLRHLDLYLTPQEAAALQESARGVFRAKLQNLNLQFTMSVTDQRWDDAVATGEQIVREFPNSRMAMEVREKMDLLRTRAAEAAAAKTQSAEQ